MKPRRMPIEITRREPPKKVIANFNHLETDEEFRDRLWREHRRAAPAWVDSSERLDAWAWSEWREQRKFIRVIKER